MKLKLVIILIIASLTRLIMLGSAPSSLYWEEVALGYDAYSIWKTGKDLHGNTMPIVSFKSFGDYKPSGYFYLAAPFVGILGLNNWSIRLPSAIAGIITVYAAYLIARKLFQNEHTALFSALTLAVMPWHIHFSRAAFEVNAAVMWFCLGVLFLLKSKEKLTYYILASVCFIFSAYTYHGLRVLAPLYAMYIVFSFGKQFMLSKHTVIVGVVSTTLMMPLLLNITNPAISQRFAETSLFSTSTAVIESNQLRDADQFSLLSRIIHHRYILWGKEIAAGMLAEFSPNFLFLTGDINQRHQTGYTALLSWWMLIPIFIAFMDKKRSNLRYLITWLLLAALPPALTNLTPHTLRFLPAAPAFAILIGYGLSKVNKVTAPLIGIAIFGSYIFYAFDYFTSYQIRSAADWQYGYSQAINFIQNYPNQSLPVQVTRGYGRPSMYFLYYLGYDPHKIQQQSSTAPKDQGELLAFDRYTFGPPDLSKPSIVINDEPIQNGTLLKLINYPNHQPALYIYEI